MSRTPSPRPALRTVNTPRDLLDVFEALTPDDLTARSRSLGLPDDALDLSVFLRLLEKIQAPDDPADPDACWLWTAKRQGAGYGLFAIDGRTRGAHRLVHALVRGPIPVEHYVLHDCDNPPCVRPSHLHAGTPTENMAEASERGRLRDRRIPQAVRHQIPGLVHHRLATTGGNRFEAFKWVADIFGLTPDYAGELYDRARRAAFDAALPSAEQVRAE